PPSSRGLPRAQMAELVDAPASGAGARKGVEVRVLFWAPISRRLRRPPPSALRLRTIGPDLPEGETAGGRFRDEVRRRVAGAVGAAFPDGDCERCSVAEGFGLFDDPAVRMPIDVLRIGIAAQGDEIAPPLGEADRAVERHAPAGAAADDRDGPAATLRDGQDDPEA